MSFLRDITQQGPREITHGRMDGHEAYLVVTLCPGTVQDSHKDSLESEYMLQKSSSPCHPIWICVTRGILLSSRIMCEMEYIFHLQSLNVYSGTRLKVGHGFYFRDGLEILFFLCWFF